MNELGRLEAIIAAASEEAERRHLDYNRAQAERREARAEAARKGELGKDWQVVQRRIDAGTTTRRDVFLGTDDSPEARRLRELSRQNLERMAAESSPPPEVEAERDAADAQYAALLRETGQAPPPSPPPPPAPRPEV